MTTFLREAGIDIEPIHVALWGIPTAICAFVIHAWRLWLLDRSLARDLQEGGPATLNADAAPADLPATAAATITAHKGA